MTARITKVLSLAEYIKLGDDAVAQGYYPNDRRVFVPGLAWYEPWYYDPHGEMKKYVAEHPDEHAWREPSRLRHEL